MKSKIKFEIHLSTNKVHFLDVTIFLKHGKLRTTLFTKPTDSHFCLNTSACHPSHVLKNITKGQFIRLRRICSRKSDYLLSSEILCKQFIERGSHEKQLKKTIKQVAKMVRNELLRDRIRENKDQQTTLVSTWHPKLSAIPSILKHNFQLICSDPKLSKIFKTERYCHLPKKQIPFRSPFEKRYCKSATSFQCNTLRRTQTLFTIEYGQTNH